MKAKLERALWSAVDAIEAAGLRYAVVGGLAFGAWARPRATRDVDLYADLPDASRPRLLAELRKRGFDVPAMSEELDRFGVFRSRLLPERVFVDIFDAVGPLGAAILDRRRTIDVDGRDLSFIAPEDLAVLKAFSDRPRDYDDLVSLLDTGLDHSYVEGWAKELDASIGGNDVSERLARATTEAARKKR